MIYTILELTSLTLFLTLIATVALIMGWSISRLLADLEEDINMIRYTITIELEASDELTARGMFDQLCLAACNIANNTTDNEAHLWVHEAALREGD